MANTKISELPSGTASASAVVPATNAAGTTTQKITLGAIRDLAHAHPISDVTGLQDALDGKQASGSYASATHSHAASDITSGTIATARLGSGTASSSTYLRGDGSWASVSVSPSVSTVSYSATVSTDASSGDIFDITLTGNVTISNPTNPTNGKTLRWRLTQDGTGGRTVTLGNKFALPESVPSLEFSAAANKTDILAATYHQPSDKWQVVALVTGY